MVEIDIFKKNSRGNLDNIIIGQLEENVELGYLELEKNVKEAERKLGSKPSSHMTIHKHLKALVQSGRVAHRSMGIGRKGAYYLIKYDARLQDIENKVVAYLGNVDKSFELIKKHFEKLSSEEKCNALLYIGSAMFFQRWQVGLATQYVDNPSFLRTADDKFNKMLNDVNKFAGQLQDQDVFLQMDVVLGVEVNRLFRMLDEILRPKVGLD